MPAGVGLIVAAASLVSCVPLHRGDGWSRAEATTAPASEEAPASSASLPLVITGGPALEGAISPLPRIAPPPADEPGGHLRLHVDREGGLTIAWCDTSDGTPGCGGPPDAMPSLDPQFVARPGEQARRITGPQIVTVSHERDGTPRALVDLLVAGPLEGAAQDDQTLAALGELLASMRRSPATPSTTATPTGPLRLLVLPRPVETAGARGQGGRRPDAVFERMPLPLQGLLRDGVIDGVLAAGSPGLEFTEDLSPAVARSSKVWLTETVFQLVVDSPVPRDASLGSPWTRGTSLQPTFISQHPGLATGRLDYASLTLRLELLVRRRGRWLSATPPAVGPGQPLPAAREVPSMAPCRDCDPREAPVGGVRR